MKILQNMLSQFHHFRNLQMGSLSFSEGLSFMDIGLEVC